MRRATIMAFVWLTLLGCKKSKMTDVKTIPADSYGINVKEIAADKPQFKRIYTAKLDERATIIITYRTYSGRYALGELDQPNGRWLLFDPERVADKIIDPILVPKVEKYCKEIYRLDREFIESNPSEFTDENGDVWRKSK